MDINLILESIGLTKGEAATYIALVKHGENSVGPIVQFSKVSKSKVYDILDKLIDKGLVGYIVRDGVKRFFANNPQMLLELIDKSKEELDVKKIEVEKLIPKFKEIKSITSVVTCVEVYEGFKALKAIREQLWDELQKGEELLVLGAPVIANEKWENWFLQQHKKREKRGVAMRIIYNSNAREYGKKRAQWKLTKVRYMPAGLVTPTWVDVLGDKTLQITTLPEKTIAILIHGKEVANSFRAYFETMWKIAEG